MTVKEITLLSVEEYQKYKSVIPLIEDDWWWLRSPGIYSECVATVSSGGNIDEFGFHVNYSNTAVRPALKLNLEMTDTRFWYKPEKLISTKLEYGKYNWTVINAELGELYALCDELITRRRFDSESDDWDTSALKRWLETEGLNLIANKHKSKKQTIRRN